jgi:hypothetical protein
MAPPLSPEHTRPAKRLPVKVAEGLKFLLEDDNAARALSTDPNVDFREWNPGLSNGDQTLAQVYATLPGDQPDEMDLMVKLIENPRSPYAITGAISLQDHDCVHILVGRGLLRQDEAFVIGFTMGTAGDRISKDEVRLFKMISSNLYADIYRFRPSDLVAFDIGVACGRKARRPVYEFEFMQHLDRSLGELRAMLGVDGHALRRAFAREQRRIPGTRASVRLPV